jgi:SAM-dependent methyltransferase
VQFGDLRRVKPISPNYGWDRGLEKGMPLDRYYIEKFFSSHASDIRGRVLEIGDDRYTRKFGGDKVTKSDVLHYVEGNPLATIVADLTCADNIPSDTFDCIVFPQTLHVIYDVRAAMRHIYRILKPGGVFLVTTQGINKIGRHEGVDDWGEYWRFTAQSMRRLFKETFTRADVEVKSYGNILAAIAFLHGLVPEDILQEELDYVDPDYEVIVAARAVKSRSAC